MFIGPEPVLDIFFCHVSCKEVCGLIFDQNTISDISLWAQAGLTQRVLGKLIQDHNRPLLRLQRERSKNKGAQWACL